MSEKLLIRAIALYSGLHGMDPVSKDWMRKVNLNKESVIISLADKDGTMDEETFNALKIIDSSKTNQKPL